MRYSRCEREDQDYGEEEENVLSQEEVKETNNTRVTYNRGGTETKLGNHQLYIETDGDEVGCESVEIDGMQRSRISHDSNVDEEESSS